MVHVAWAALLEDGVLCDMRVISRDGESIAAHKLVLAAQSQTIREAIKNHQPSEAEFVVHTDFSLDVTQQVVKALYTSKFEPLDEPCLGAIEEEQDHRPDESGSCDEIDDNDRCPHQMMFCAQAIRLFLSLRLFSGDLVQKIRDALEKISGYHLYHVDFPVVVEYTPEHNYEHCSSNAPWFASLYKNYQRVREVLKTVLFKHPDVFATLCDFLVRELTVTEKKLYLTEGKLAAAEGEAKSLRSSVTEFTGLILSSKRRRY